MRIQQASPGSARNQFNDQRKALRLLGKSAVLNLQKDDAVSQGFAHGHNSATDEILSQCQQRFRRQHVGSDLFRQDAQAWKLGIQRDG
jgi:hypothetical protein